MRVKVKVINESGYKEALLGLSLNKKKYINSDEDFAHMEKVARVLAPKDYGHSKFLESIYLWVDVTMPRYFWQEADTYRLSTKQSESTLKGVIMRQEITQEDFVEDINLYFLLQLNDFIKNEDHRRLKQHLPEGYLQRRLWVFNYKTLRNILIQRQKHYLPEWKYFCRAIYSQVLHPELLPTIEGCDAKREIDG